MTALAATPRMSDEELQHAIDFGTIGGKNGPALVAETRRAREAEERLKATVADLVNQFAYYSGGGALTTGGLSALEGAFGALGWDDPHPAPERRCDEPGCEREGSCGWPSPDGYRRTCAEHWGREKALAP